MHRGARPVSVEVVAGRRVVLPEERSPHRRVDLSVTTPIPRPRIQLSLCVPGVLLST